MITLRFYLPRDIIVVEMLNKKKINIADKKCENNYILILKRFMLQWPQDLYDNSLSNCSRLKYCFGH